MTAESTVPPPAGGSRGAAGSAVSFLDPPGAAACPELPSGRATRRSRRISWTPLLIADLSGTLLGALAMPEDQRNPLLIAFLGLCVLSLNRRAQLYDTSDVAGIVEELPAVCGRVAIGWAVVAALTSMRQLPLTVLGTACAVHCLVACAGREAVHGRRRRRFRRRPRPALVVGPAPAAMQVAAALQRRPGCGTQPVGLVADAPHSVPPSADRSPLPVLTTREDAHRALIQNGVETVLVVGASTRVRKAPLLRELAAFGCVLWELDTNPPSYGPRGRRGRAGHLVGFPRRLLCTDSGRRGGGAVGKRMLDIVFSGVLLLLAGPVLLACAAGLRITEGSGVVIRQERIGQGGRPFTMLKFRTHPPAGAHAAATRWSGADEQDTSRFCQFLRRTSLDELPQLWNVFRGDMSLVGPRPERPYSVTKFSQAHPGYAARHRVSTGITGLAQVNGLRGETSIEDRCRFDNAYIDTWSLWQDVCILVRTAVQFVRPTGG
ncbi:transferase [Streptomyces sp. IMTB 2501]|uniref:exopolysaccharide biosynthesis polyprenyl glycosylphosphotransferase n=1 Tax=Streptomyces sp. IMTB 2501 TaxID=1776340 RepID=UPI00096E3F93|nr:exopolysaccharide biosynthesis polyprenyl glycosylphosphotransferase [Streptomyces sp. IMTB 2501]OLZ65801.1 transferase [Streptomyces sp. IMTB 2501]